MPLLFTHHPFPGATFGMWRIAEDESFFREAIPLAPEETAELALHQNPLRRAEWLAGRWLLHKLSGHAERLSLAKDAFSKPFFPENETLSCSLSHSRGNVGALIAEGVNSIGCDIQVLTEKMPRIAHKFLDEQEARWTAGRPAKEYLDLLHLFWTAKESLYKAYGLKALDFRAHIHVREVDWDGCAGAAQGLIEKEHYRQTFELRFGKTQLSDTEEIVYCVCGAGE